ncbi:MAG: two-component regulator propeller domain-containing protein [Prolixibacteraceae bacterium]
MLPIKKVVKWYLFLIVFAYLAVHSTAAEIDRFEFFTTDDGLSQNTITSILCDSRGFLWFGTYNGLNRFDGYHFKVYQNSNQTPGILTNNRVTNIWEDQKNFLWFETYDGYFHRYNPVSESFFTLPKYLQSPEEKYSKMNCFYQYSPEEIWLGSSNSGVYRLVYDSLQNEYVSEQFLSRGQYSISNNNIRFITSDRDSNLYIGTKNGLNVLPYADMKAHSFYYQHYFSDLKFTSSVVQKNEVWFGTENSGVVVYYLDTKSFYVFNAENSPLKENSIDILKLSSQGNVLIGGADLYIFQPVLKRWLTVEIEGDHIDKIFEDYSGVLWVTTGKFGVQKVDQLTGTSKHFDLAPENIKYLSDKQRPYFYEDSNHILWICLHGAGLAQYNRQEDKFSFFRNNPLDPKSISSNTIMCATEDQNGNLWVGAGLDGGINKVILKNPAFTAIQFKSDFKDNVENIVRSVFEDQNRVLWVAAKGGELKLYNEQLNEIRPGLNYPFSPVKDLVFNVYAIFQDSRGYIWLGSKGAGVAVSAQPVDKTVRDYSKIKFYSYVNSPGNPNSLCNDNIYSIVEDIGGNIWIGTYGAGLSMTKPDHVRNLTFTSINTENSNLTNDLTRQLLIDSKNNLWVATTFGLNKLDSAKLIKGSYDFECFYHDIDDANSICYNDVVHVFEDTNNNIWLGTFGGGVSVINTKNKIHNYTHVDGLINQEVYGITEDREGFIWFSTGNGLSRLDPRSKSFENFNKSNSLSTNSFSENSCAKARDGRLVFGSIRGIEVVDPSKIEPRKYSSHVTFTNFQLFNNDMDVNTPESPLTESILCTDEIVLAHNQSSFGVEFSAMNFLDKSKTQYAYFLENFDNNWNYIGTERKATYTNLKPGEYVLKVKAALWNDNWENEETSMRIIIQAPWWQTNLAYIIYLIVFIFGTFMITRSVIRVNSYRNELKVEKAVNEVKLQFFTNISHEIRTPLTLILGPIEDLLADSKFPSDYRSTLLLVQKNGQRMLHLLNQLLDFRKVQNKKMTLKITPVNMVEFTRGIFDNFVPQAHHKQIDFQFNAICEPELVWVDPHRMDSVIFNILSNAFKFTPKGSCVNVSIDQNKRQNEVYIKISDGGPGIKSKDIPLLFNRYSILSGESDSENGTGIGLNLSHEVVKIHGGEIRVESLPGKGSDFTIVLKTGNSHFSGKSNIFSLDPNFNTIIPVKQLADEQTDLSTELLSTEKTVVASEKKTVLVVEDNQQILKYIADALSNNYSVITAKNGREALTELEAYPPDLIISDIMMPVMGGIEMTKIVKANFETCHIPVVLLTAKSSVDDQILGIESGAEAYVLKPFNMAVLKTMIANILEQRKLVLKKFGSTPSIEVSDLKINSKNKEFLELLVKYIEENHNNHDFSIVQLAEHFCVSRTVFYNKIKSLTGLSPIELIRQIKLKIAAQMLLSGYNVNEVADKIGFSDTRYFSKQFKEMFGESPSKYKKRNQSEVEIVI